ncbi:hypothetical protein COY16_04005 [Candidatus Roizmanbacteria bacterium CG_4_10_14_0_2_um_filter_39_13]|uniref:CBS domain-containing protein n=1 Tax=Candidatus Roizmanbacteria bacterium CG_4_10_14_0_2_um_filter_39_13 TaxID=1974825 RepID=A0A2M7TXQ4_9BACT|nr:MAG: hypothetical protein COY16_04005 [Candidatus Roizmanbacteria bacterium CG_4_10_14_0_2_um_filter_39_13]
MNILHTKYKVNPIPSHLICNIESTISSIVNRFQNTHTPLLAYEDNKKFMGLVTVQNTLFNRKHNSSTNIRSCLITPPKIFINTPIGEILREMSKLKLYALPVFDKSDKVVGLVKAKPLLKKLMKDDLFAEEMIKTMPKRSVSTIPQESTIGKAYHAFQKHAVSRLIVVNSDNKIKGMISKRDIFFPYFTSSNRQRFSTRSKTKNYSFDEEKMKEDNQLLMNFISPIVEVLSEKTNASEVIRTLITCKYNSIVIINKDRQPLFIYTTNDLLKTAVSITKKTPTLLTIISKLPQELNEGEKKKISRDLRLLAVWINKQYKIQLIRFTSKTVYNPERKPILFEVKLTITTDSATFFTDNKNRDFMHNVEEVISEIKKQVRRMKKVSEIVHIAARIKK